MNSLFRLARLIWMFLPLACLLTLPRARAATVEDVEFLMASDAGVTVSGWVNEVNFVLDAVNSILPLFNDQVGIIEFSTTNSVKVPLTELTPTSRTSIANTVMGLSFLQQNTYMLDAILSGITLLQTDTNAADPKFMVLISDGSPNPTASQNPCDTSGNIPNAAVARADLVQDGITVLEVFVGPSVNMSATACLVGFQTNQQALVASAPAMLSSFVVPGPSIPAPEPNNWSLLLMAMIAAPLCRSCKSMKKEC